MDRLALATKVKGQGRVQQIWIAPFQFDVLRFSGRASVTQPGRILDLARVDVHDIAQIKPFLPRNRKDPFLRVGAFAREARLTGKALPFVERTML